MFKIMVFLVGSGLAWGADPEPDCAARLKSLGIDKPKSEFADSFVVLGSREFFDQQLIEANEFLRNLYVDVFGDTKRPYLFQELVLVGQERTGRLLTLQGTRLYVGIPKTLVTRKRKLVSAFELRTAWDRGDHLNSVVEKRAWLFLNPAGTFRIGMRMELARIRTDLLQVFDRIRELPIEQKLRELRPIFQRAGQATGDSDLELRFAGLQGAAKERFVADLEARVRDPKALRDMEAAGLSAMANSRAARDYDIQIFGGIVAYGNIHDIHVDIATSRWTTLVRAVEQPRTTKVRVISIFGAGFTVDNITVSLDFSGALEAAAILEALETAE